MIPESARAGAIRLYRASEFPRAWVLDRELLQGSYYDPSVVRHRDRWWMWATDASQSLRLFHAAELRGPWVEHGASPVVRNDPRTCRSGGRVIEHAGGLIRFAQDGQDGYGSRLWAFRIDAMDETQYRESEIPGGPVLGATGSGWTATGMHQVDAQRLDSGEWIAAVDGNAQHQVLNWRAGLRQLQSRLLLRGPRN
jgi:hypothetical protein